MAIFPVKVCKNCILCTVITGRDPNIAPQTMHSLSPVKLLTHWSMDWTDSNKLQICSVIKNTALTELFKLWPQPRKDHLIKYHPIKCIHEITFEEKH